MQVSRPFSNLQIRFCSVFAIFTYVVIQFYYILSFHFTKLQQFCLASQLDIFRYFYFHLPSQLYSIHQKAQITHLAQVLLNHGRNFVLLDLYKPHQAFIASLFFIPLHVTSDKIINEPEIFEYMLISFRNICINTTTTLYKGNSQESGSY